MTLFTIIAMIAGSLLFLALTITLLIAWWSQAYVARRVKPSPSTHRRLPWIRAS